MFELKAVTVIYWAWNTKHIFHVGILNILLSNGKVYSVLNQNKPQNKYVWYFTLSQEPPTNGDGGRKYFHILELPCLSFQQYFQNYCLWICTPSKH